jgi:hypothetical protein
MPDNVKLTSDKGSMQDRINARLRNSGEGKGVKPDVVVQKGNSPLRTFTNIHHSASNETKESKKGSRG